MDDWYEPKKSVGKAGQMRDRARTMGVKRRENRRTNTQHDIVDAASIQERVTAEERHEHISLHKRRREA